MDSSVKYAVIALVYRNSQDLQCFIDNARQMLVSSRIVVIDSYYSEETSNEIKRIAELNDCDYLRVENRGYGAGNNAGISYALKTFSFKYLIVCNNDLKIDQFDDSKLTEDSVYGPLITTLSGKHQNPLFSIRSRLSEKLLYKGFSTKNKLALFTGFAINKLLREINYLIFKHSDKKIEAVHAIHGAFFIISSTLLKSHFSDGRLFDENMFLYYEEAYMGVLFERIGIPVKLTKEISVTHFEDGSTRGLADYNPSKFEASSYQYFYETYCCG